MENDGNQVQWGLAVQMSDGCGFGGDGVVVVVMRVIVLEGFRVTTVAESSVLLF